MMIDAAIWASGSGLTAKLALALAVAAGILTVTDGRPRGRLAVSGVQWLCCLVAFQVFWYSPSNVVKYLWCAVSVLAALMGVRAWWQWNRIPVAVRQVNEELKTWPSQRLLLVASILEAATIAAAILLAINSGGATWLSVVGVVHLVLAASALGLTTSVSLSLTTACRWSDRSDRWRLPVRIAGLLFGMASFYVLSAVLLPVASDADEIMVGAVRVFAVVLMTLYSLVLWLPWQAGRLSHASNGTADRYVSLVVAAWLTWLSLIVVCVLPWDWPWRLLA